MKFTDKFKGLSMYLAKTAYPWMNTHSIKRHETIKTKGPYRLNQLCLVTLYSSCFDGLFKV